MTKKFVILCEEPIDATRLTWILEHNGYQVRSEGDLVLYLKRVKSGAIMAKTGEKIPCVVFSPDFRQFKTKSSKR